MTEGAPLELNPAMTAGALGDLLAAKYPRDRYALFFNVPDDVGLKARRRADAIAFGLWGSVGHFVDGFELKVSRSDWLREVKQVEKADPFVARCDRWWLVTSSPAIAKLEEIPACWGWMAATKGGLRVQRPAPRLPQPADGAMQRLFVLGVLRMAQEHNADPETHRRAIDDLRRQHTETFEARIASEVERQTRKIPELNEKVAAAEKAVGLKITDWKFERVAKLAKKLVELSYGFDLAHVDKVLEGQENTLVNLIECVKLARALVKEPT